MSYSTAQRLPEQETDLHDGLRLLRATLADFDRNPSLTRARIFRAAGLMGLLPAEATTSRAHAQPLTHRSANLVLDHIERHLDKSIRIRDLASVVGLSASHFCRSFKAHFGISTNRFIKERRLEHAKHLMRTTDMPLIDIALACGMCDQSHLCNLFRRHYGESPNRWRRAQRRH